MRKALLVVAVVTVAAGLAGGQQEKAPAKSADKSGLGQFSWLLGSWEAVGSFRNAIERWTRDSTGVMHGEILLTKAPSDTTGKDSSVIQNMRLEKSGTDLVLSVEYVQRNITAKFIYARRDTGGVFFDNPVDSQYPQQVCYKPVRTDSLYTWMSGLTPGGLIQRQGYRFKRVN